MTFRSSPQSQAGMSIVPVFAMSAAMILAMMAGMMAGMGAFQNLRKQQMVVERSEVHLAIVGTIQMILQSEPMCIAASWRNMTIAQASSIRSWARKILNRKKQKKA